MVQIERYNNELLHEIKELNKKFYDDVDLEWYTSDLKDTFSFVCCRENKTLVGYAVIMGLTENAYQSLIDDFVLVNDDEGDNEEVIYAVETPYYYLSSIVVAEDVRRKGYGHQIMNLVMQQRFPSLSAITVSKEGLTLLSRYMDIKSQLGDYCFVLEKKAE
jgi:GNAT superfamily N-acetyltransferase